MIYAYPASPLKPASSSEPPVSRLAIPGSRINQPRGFALIATISVMILLVMIALAMLSLSTIELRVSRNGDAMQEARANARLALMLALGELQKQAGPDQRVTATGGITGTSANHRHIAGVWESWRADPFSPPSSYASVKKDKFKGWLVSHKDPTVVEQVSFALNGSFTDPVEMLGEGTLGNGADKKDYLTAGKVSVQTGRKGKMAWVAMDEGVKARVDIPMEQNTGSVAERSANLGAASRVAFEKVYSQYDPFTSQTKKFISLKETELSLHADMGKYAHDLTVWSQGPMTNVVDGGLREDMSLLTDGSSLPSQFANAHIYSGRSNGLAGADPYWQQIFEYASLYKKVRNVNGLPLVDTNVPNGYVPVKWDSSRRGFAAKKDPPKGMLLAPVIAKVQVVFSLISRRSHGPWPAAIWNRTRDPKRKYMLHLLYSPIVTLYNPYNVAIKFDKMKVEFENVPIGFQFYRNNQAQTTRQLPMNQLYVWHETNSNVTKSFSITLQGKGASGHVDPNDPEPVTLLPGEVRVFSPYFEPGYSWFKELGNGNGFDYFDWQDKTNKVISVPGWLGLGIGYDADWLTPRIALSPQDGDHLGILALSWTDTVRVDYSLLPSQASKNRMQIRTLLYKGNRVKRLGVIDVDYGSKNKLQSMLPPPKGKQYTYPQRGEAGVTCGQIYENGNTPIADYERPQAFCVFSLYGKTAFGGTPGAADGRHASKAWTHLNVISNVSEMDLTKDHPSRFAYEMNFEPLPGNADNQVQVDKDDRGNFITGHTALNGLKFGTHNEIPIAPIQSIANLQNANLCSSGYLPKFDYPVANSFAHPLMPAGSVRVGDMLDHSYLLNHYLYDRFYCSTVSEYSGAMFGSKSRTTEKVFEDFLKGEQPLLDHRFIAWTSGGKSIADILDEVTGTGAGKEGYKKIAAYQMLRGEWNVNSLSIPAWKTMLAGLHQTDFPIYDVLSQKIIKRTKAVNPMSRFRLPNGKAEKTSDPDLARRQRWTGYRELDDTELNELAEAIVEEVRARGPFLSLAEFVNRRLTGSSQETRSGALQAAIDRTKINDDLKQDGLEITAHTVRDYEYKNVDAATGNSAQGAPGSITQGHILNALGNAVTVRSNTFTIRAYGESLDANGNVRARAWCEAVVQRVPEYLDNSEEPDVKTADLTSPVNIHFGRRMRIVSFRWLSPDEV